MRNMPKRNWISLIGCALAVSGTWSSASTANVRSKIAPSVVPSFNPPDLSAANDCMQKGLAILDDPNSTPVPGPVQMMDRDSLNQIRDVMAEFFANPDMTVADAQAQFVEIVKNAPPL